MHPASIFGEKERILKSKQRNITLVLEDRIAEKKVKGLALAYFDRISPQKVIFVKASYPKTIKALFELSQEIYEGKYGEKILEKFLCIDESQTELEVILLLLFKKTCCSGEKEVSEIFDKLKEDSRFCDWVRNMKNLSFEKIEMSPDLNNLDSLLNALRTRLIFTIAKLSIRKELLHIFNNFMANFANPSHVTIDLFLERQSNIIDIEKSFIAASKIKNASERILSISHIVDKLFSLNQAVKAFDFVKDTTKKEQDSGLLIHFAEVFFHSLKGRQNKAENAMIDSLIQLVQSLSNLEDKKKIMKRIVFGLAKNGLFDRAIQISNLIRDKEAHDYILSCIVQLLVSKKQFKKATEVMDSIALIDFQQDASEYLKKEPLERIV